MENEILRYQDHPTSEYLAQVSNTSLSRSSAHTLSSTALYLIAWGQMKWFKYKFSRWADDGHIIVIWELRKHL